MLNNKFIALTNIRRTRVLHEWANRIPYVRTLYPDRRVGFWITDYFLDVNRVQELLKSYNLLFIVLSKFLCTPDFTRGLDSRGSQFLASQHILYIPKTRPRLNANYCRHVV